jgi:quercetin dioxygenase-like cupin family protein
MLGGVYEVKISSEESDGAMTVMEMLVPATAGPPAHTHPGSETVYVIEGHLRYHIGDETYEGGPGAIFHVPEGVVENFEPLTESRLLVIYKPGGVEKFFEEAGEPAQAGVLPPPPDSPPDLDRLIEIGQRHGMQIRPPAIA